MRVFDEILHESPKEFHSNSRGVVPLTKQDSTHVECCKKIGQVLFFIYFHPVIMLDENGYFENNVSVFHQFKWESLAEDVFLE